LVLALPQNSFAASFYYDNCSFSIYKKSDAIATAGKTRPTRGTKIEGRIELIMEFSFSNKVK